MVAAANAAEEAKARKRALVEAELRDAISALRKPNRELAGKSMAEAAERRALSLSAMRSKWQPYHSGRSLVSCEQHN